MVRGVRSFVHKQDASGDIVVVGIDDRTINSVEQWPLRRARYASLVDAARHAGARNLMVDLDLSTRSTAEDDALLEASMANARGRVALPIRFLVDPITQMRTTSAPLARFARHATLVNVNFFSNYQQIAWHLPRSLELEGKTYRSLASYLAEAPQIGGQFPVDYSTRLASIPVISAVDLVEGRVLPDRLSGKNVVIGVTSPQQSEKVHLPGSGKGPRVYLHVLGAETLKRGQPVDLGWLLPLLTIAGLGGAYVMLTNRVSGRLALLTGLVIVGPLSVVAEQRLIFYSVVPGTVLLLALIAERMWMHYRQSYKARGTTNAVTGLPNLAALRERSGTSVRTLAAARIQNYAAITAALPHESEKALVEQIVARLAIGAGEAPIHQGDEGIFVWTSSDPVESLGDQLEALHALCRAPIAVEGVSVDLVISFGVDADGSRSVVNRIGSALVAADEAAKEGRRWKEFDASKLEDAAWKLSLLGRLDAAIDGGEIWVAYQPKLDLSTKRITGAEALVRWSHPEKGEIGPIEFIPAAEEHNRIEKLTTHVLATAIRTAADINARGIEFQIAVNLSARLLDSEELVDGVAALLAKHRLSARRLTLEVTESSAVDGNARSLATLEALRALGVHISIDDYGTGFSTLDYLKRIPATEIKIDRSFVAAIERSQSDKLMVNSTIQLAHSLGRTVVAEGVETQETLRALEAMNCDEAQGWLIGRPMRLADLLKLLATELKRDVA
jgi:EAL domain-containing protein (putative c-di-GMP-specific phosphodiesterase class I)/CHASE2 domain-containing sensor protein